MATTKKTTTKAKTAAVKDTTNEIIEEVKETETTTVVASDPVVEPVIIKEKKVFTDSDYILCRSVYSGGLNVIAPSGILYEFKDYGYDCDINYRDLVQMIRRGSEHVFKPRFVILDEDFLEDFPTVSKVYGEMYTMSDLLAILDLPLSQMKAEIARLPKDTRDSMPNVIATQIANGRLDSISKVRALTEIFDLDFNLLSDLFVR